MPLSPPEPAPSTTGSPCIDARHLGKLRWRCRRGMKELDLLLTRYVEERFCTASVLEQDAFQALLDMEDGDLYACCLGTEPPPRRFAALVEQITATARSAG